MMLASHERIQHKLRSELGAEILQALLDDNVQEVMLNEDGVLWFDTRHGMVAGTGLQATKAYHLICTIASMTGQEVHQSKPDIAAELLLIIDQAHTLFRFQGLIPPVVAAPVFSIRKPARHIYSLHDYVTKQILSAEAATFLSRAVMLRHNILVVGGTGSGKTTFCNALLHTIAEQCAQDRIILIEDTQELQCHVPNKLQLRSSETRSTNDLLRCAMRLRPDRIVVGEVRGKEAYDLIKAWNTGHPGGVSTIHANDAISGLTRVMQLIEEAGVVPVGEAVASAVQLVVFIHKDMNHPAKRRVGQIISVEGYTRTSQQFMTKEVVCLASTSS